MLDMFSKYVLSKRRELLIMNMPFWNLKFVIFFRSEKVFLFEIIPSFSNKSCLTIRFFVKASCNSIQKILQCRCASRMRMRHLLKKSYQKKTKHLLNSVENFRTRFIHLKERSSNQQISKFEIQVAKILLEII